MGSVAGQFKLFLDEFPYRGLWTEQKLVDKVAAGFTVATYPSGDKLNTIIQLSIFAAQFGMIRTFATIAEGLDLSAYALKRLLNHKMNNDVTAGIS